jgi:DNA recombination protein RmuC
MLAAIILLAIACAALLAACVWLYARQHAITADRDRLTAELRDARGLLDKHAQESRDLLAQVERQRATADQMRQQFDAAQQQARDTFSALAGDVLKHAEDRFLKLANENFEGKQKDASAQLEQRQQAIDALLKPIREAIEKQSKAVTELESKREGAYQGLKQIMSSMLDDQRRLQSETGKLVQALRRPDVRGRWGEVQLRRVAELAGMIDRCDFTEQVSGVDSEGKTKRPDMIVHLPAGRDIVVDSKAPIDAYLAALDAGSDEQREQELMRYVRHVEEKVIDLAGKNYQSQFARSPDFVVLFIPGESFLQAALSRKPDLMETAFNRGVIIATPSTLIALLKAVAIGWREEQLADNARRISDLGVELHRRLAVMSSHLQNLGKAVEKTVEHFNKTVGSYESQVLVQARRFKDLGADSPRELPAEGDTAPIETAPREVKAIEP